MPSTNTTALTTTGYATTNTTGANAKPPSDTLTTITLYPTGTSVGVQFTVQATRDTAPSDSGNWFNVLSRDVSTGLTIGGGTTISPTDSVSASWEVPSEGFTAVRANVSQLTSGTANFQLDTASYIGAPSYTYASYSTTAFGASTFSGTISSAAVIPTTNDVGALGDATHGFADLFLASGAVVNYANGNWVATHTSGILTVGTGDLRVTTAGTNTASVVTVGGTQTLAAKTFTAPVLGVATGTSLTATGIIASTGTAGIGYATGAGGTVTQASSITTGVTLNTTTGTITTVAATLGAGVDASFTVTNSTVAATDTIVINTKSYGGTADGIPICKIQSVAAGSFVVNVHNQGAVALDAAVVMSFAVIKGVAA